MRRHGLFKAMHIIYSTTRVNDANIYGCDNGLMLGAYNGVRAAGKVEHYTYYNNIF